MPDLTPTEARPCSCGDRRRAGINHRITIPFWAYIGTQRVEINSAGTIARLTDPEAAP